MSGEGEKRSVYFADPDGYLRFIEESDATAKLELNLRNRTFFETYLTTRSEDLTEGLSKKNVLINGKWEDHLHFAIVNPDD